MNAFQVLSRGGAKYKNQQFRADFEAFSEDIRQNEPRIGQASEENSALSVPVELDFFKYARSIGSEKKMLEIDEDAKAVVERHERSVKKRRIEQKMGVFEQKHRVVVKGSDAPPPIESFEELEERYKISMQLLSNLSKNGYNAPTGIQSHAVPILCEGRDLAAISPTGTGKTLAYLLPLLLALRTPHSSTGSRIGIRALILAPTRELAHQIHNEALKLISGRKWRIVLLNKATANTLADKHVRHKTDIIISTPLRLVASIRSGNFDLENVQFLILDEADRLFDTEFLYQTQEICKSCTDRHRQTAVFSATLPAGAETLAMMMLKDPIRIVVGLKDTPLPLIKQALIYVADEASKLPTLLQFLSQPYNPPLLIFATSQDRASSLAEQLVLRGISNVDCLHAGMSKKAREDAISRMRQGESWIMISTEVMARGMDFKGIRTVINFDFPRNVQSYVHRIGRTGRAGREGKAITYFTNEDSPFLKPIANVLLHSGSSVPEWILKLPNPSKMKRKEMGKVKRGKTVTRAERLARALAAKKRDMVKASMRRVKAIKTTEDWSGIN